MVLSTAFVAAGSACVEDRAGPESPASRATRSARRMADGKQWMTENLNLHTDQSYCYENADANCQRYGRLYSWAAAQQACRSLGDGWRLPTNDDWKEMANHYGGLREDTADLGRAAYTALLSGGSAGFNAVLGGGRTDKSGEYLRGDAHGFYWTATESGADTAWFYNFGKGGQSLGRHRDGEKQRAFAVRCIRN